MAKKIAGGLLALFILYFVATKPVAAAACAKGIGSILITVANGFGDFFTSLVK